jgi:hypothetical protein
MHLSPNTLVAANITTDTSKVAKTIGKVLFIITKKYTGGIYLRFLAYFSPIKN